MFVFVPSKFTALFSAKKTSNGIDCRLCNVSHSAGTGSIHCSLAASVGAEKSMLSTRRCTVGQNFLRIVGDADRSERYTAEAAAAIIVAT